MKRQHLILAAASLLILVVITLLLFRSAPYFGYNYPLSYPALIDRYDKLESLQHDYTMNQAEYGSKIDQYTKLSTTVAKMSSELSSVLGDDDYTFHLPSVLIMLEQDARKCGLKEIWIDRVSRMPEETSVESESELELEEPVSMRLNYYYPLQINIKGNYNNIRDYLMILGSMDMVSVSSIDVTLDDESGNMNMLNALITLHIYHYSGGY